MKKYVLVLIAGLSFSAALNAEDIADLFVVPVSVNSRTAGRCLAFQDNGSTGMFCQSLTSEQQCNNYSTVCFWSAKRK
jgi:hypothetical protein